MCIRILLVDDFEPWRRFVCSIIQKEPELAITCEVSDGLEAVQKAEELGPDLILLDIGLPGLNGIEAARRIRQLSPNSKIVFLSTDNSIDVVQAALSTGAQSYVHKLRIHHDLLPAIAAALRGKQSVRSACLENGLADIVGRKASRIFAGKLGRAANLFQATLKQRRRL